MGKHRTFIKSEDVCNRSGTLDLRELAFQIENMNYGTVSHFFAALRDAFKVRAAADGRAGRHQLEDRLGDVISALDDATVRTWRAWTLCEVAEAREKVDAERHERHVVDGLGERIVELEIPTPRTPSSTSRTRRG